jgi:hypothetical protein
LPRSGRALPMVMSLRASRHRDCKLFNYIPHS